MPRSLATLLACALTGGLALVLAACGPNADQQASVPGSVGAPAHLASSGRLTVAVPAALPPYGYRGAGGDVEGFAADLGAAMAERLGLRAHLVAVDSDALDATARSSGADVVIGTTPLTRTTTPPSGYALVPYVMAGSELLVPLDSPFQPQDLTELCGHAVAVVSGTAEEALLNTSQDTQCGPAPPKVQSLVSNDDAVRAVNDGTADAYLADSATAAFDKARYGGLMTTSAQLGTAELGLALRADNPSLEDALTRAYYTVRADGEYETLLKKWGMTEQSL